MRLQGDLRGSWNHRFTHVLENRKPPHINSNRSRSAQGAQTQVRGPAALKGENISSDQSSHPGKRQPPETKKHWHMKVVMPLLLLYKSTNQKCPKFMNFWEVLGQYEAVKYCTARFSWRQKWQVPPPRPRIRCSPVLWAQRKPLSDLGSNGSIQLEKKMEKESSQYILIRGSKNKYGKECKCHYSAH